MGFSVAGREFTFVELFMVLAILLLLAVVLLPAFARAFGVSERSNCVNNLKEWGQIFTMYATESPDGKYPPLQLENGADATGLNGAAAPRVLEVWPAYLTDPSILSCPADVDNPVTQYQNEAGQWALDDPKVRVRAGDSYYYFGWALDKCGDEDPTQDIQPILQLAALSGAAIPNIDMGGVLPPAQLVKAVMAIAQEIMKAASLKQPLGEAALRAADMDVFVGTAPDGAPLGNGSSEAVYRLRRGLGAFIAADAGPAAAEGFSESEVFVMFDKVKPDLAQYNHPPGGCNVLYLDGHVEFVRYPGKPPVSKGAVALVGSVR